MVILYEVLTGHMWGGGAQSFDVTNREVGLSPDKKPSVVISYNNSELYATRFIDEELRRVMIIPYSHRCMFDYPAIKLDPLTLTST